MEAQFEIRVQGHLDARLADWFDGAALTASGDGTTLLCVSVADQAALQGALRRIADLGLTLISVNAAKPAA
ncbi:MAG: hypothetical protein WC580_08060 [Agrococcus sp.]